MMRIPRPTDDKGYLDVKAYKLLHKTRRPEGSDKGLHRSYTRLTITIRKELLQKLETAAYWKWKELFEARSLEADYKIPVNDIVNEILEDYFEEHPVKDMPDEEYMHQYIERAHKFNARFRKRQQKKK